jgi:hypothetical protein
VRRDWLIFSPMKSREAVQRALDDAAAQRGRMRPVDVVIGQSAEKSEQPRDA